MKKKNYQDEIWQINRRMDKTEDPAERKKLEKEVLQLHYKHALNFEPREAKMWKALIEGKHDLASQIRDRNYKISLKERKKKARLDRKCHPTHRMTKWCAEAWSPHGGEPRFYASRHCKNCKHYNRHHAAGTFNDPELKSPCPNQPKRKPKTVKRKVS